MKKITVFTPTYNRAYCLHQVYDSLCRQSSQDFCWLIIDDGSIDTTKTLVETWISEGEIKIQYNFKENGGMHTGHNVAYELIETELNVCIDSDDFMPDNAIELIINKWEQVKGDESIAGIVGLDIDKKGQVIGTKLPREIQKCTLSGLYQQHKVLGDKKLVYKTSVIKEYPLYPVFKGEKFVPLDYKCLLIDQDYDLALLNEPLIIVEYQPDGSTQNILKQYRDNPRGFAFSRVSRIKYGITFKERFKNMIHLVSSAIFLKDYKLLFSTSKIFLMLLAVPFGILLNLYIRFKS